MTRKSPSLSCPVPVQYSPAVVVRQVPIVIEGGEGDSDEMGDGDKIVTTPACGVVDDRSSLSSLSSDNSVEEGGRRGRRRDGGVSSEYYSWDDWRERRKMVGAVVDREMVAEGRGRTPGMQFSVMIVR